MAFQYNRMNTLQMYIYDVFLAVLWQKAECTCTFNFEQAEIIFVTNHLVFTFSNPAVWNVHCFWASHVLHNVHDPVLPVSGSPHMTILSSN